MRATLCRAAAVLAAVLALGGCRRYGEIRLPVLNEPAEAGSWHWTAHPAPVMSRGAPGAWDSIDTLNPSVWTRNGLLWNLYSGYDGKTWRTGLATSADGLVWQRAGVVLSPDPHTWEGTYIGANGAVVYWQDGWLYFYQAGDPPQIGLARSADGKTWTRLPHPVLEFGPRGSWDERALADPYVFLAGGRLFLYYLGEDRARQQLLGVASSTDGVSWTKLRSGPVLEPGEPGSMDENGLGEPAVFASHGSYWMIFTGRARNEVRRLGMARSRDGVHWERLPLVIQGEADWNSQVICDPTVEVTPEKVRVWFGGGDVAHPAENIHGQIGYGELTWVPAGN